jgi:hypothetical protein
MRAHEIIRGLLDLLDGAKDEQQATVVQIAVEPNANEFSDDVRRFKQIVDLADTDGSMSPFSNAPNEQYADLDAVTTNAGGGVNGPKHPSDIRGEHPSMYPAHQHGVKD